MSKVCQFSDQVVAACEKEYWFAFVCSMFGEVTLPSPILEESSREAHGSNSEREESQPIVTQALISTGSLSPHVDLSLAESPLSQAWAHSSPASGRGTEVQLSSLESSHHSPRKHREKQKHISPPGHIHPYGDYFHHPMYL